MGEGVLDLAALLAPLPAGEGAGEDLRPDYSLNSLYQRIRTQRNDARTGERAIEGGDPEANPALVATAWREVKKLGIEALSTRSKDFEIAAWMAEALVRVDGLAGLADAAELIAGLCERFWEHGFPRLDDEDGIEGRAAPIGGLSGEGADGTVMGPIRRFPLFQRPDGTACDLFTWQRAEETAAISDPDRRAARLQAGIPDFDALQNEARADLASLRAAGAAARKALAAWTALDAALTARLGADAPSTRRVTDALQAIIEVSARIAGAPAEAAAEEAGAGAETGGVAATPAPAAPAAASGPRPLRSREDAIRQLEEIAEFFRRTEPHSPLAFTLQDAVRRARMPLVDLLAEVLPDAAARRQLLTALGIHVPEEQ
jgi:type VI secretion system protein ImpA